MEIRHLRVLGDVGQVVAVTYDIRDSDSLRAAMARSNVVINLVGLGYETRNFSFDAVHHQAPALFAEVARECGVERFLHVSALNASVDSPSAFLKSKALGEQAVLKSYPDATIFRPAIMFGKQDKFMNNYAKLMQLLPIVPLVNGGSGTIQPVFVSGYQESVFRIDSSDEKKRCLVSRRCFRHCGDT